MLISTHAPLAGRDRLLSRPAMRPLIYFNPRAPCGARRYLNLTVEYLSQFQPTRPLRGATEGGNAASP